MKYEFVTKTTIFESYKLKATQKYNTEFNTGHISMYAENKDGDLIYVYQSSGSPIEGKISTEWMKDQILWSMKHSFGKFGQPED